MQKNIIILLSLVWSFIFFTPVQAEKLDLTVSPIKYEIEGFKASTITKTATLYNYGEKTIHVTTDTGDFISGGINGKPNFLNKSLKNPDDQYLSDWIQIDTPEFDIEAGEEKTVIFSVDIPENATPGGHYGAVFFNYQNSNSKKEGNNVGINTNYGVLLLVNVDGEILTKGEVDSENIIIVNLYQNNKNLALDSCFLFDFTTSKYDGYCFNIPFREEFPLSLSSAGEEKEHVISFEIPFKNLGNTHIKPKGKITLIDENGNQIKGVGKKVVTNDAGAIIGEEIVDYLPVNDSGGNVLLGSSRTFFTDWKGFPYKGYDDDGNPVMYYWSPEEYYTKQNTKDAGVLMFWQRVYEVYKTKKITAQVELTYTDDKGEEVEFNSAHELSISYVESEIGINWYIILGVIGVLLIVILLYILARANQKKCIKCENKIDKKMKLCPYCGTKQKKKK